MYVRTGAMPEKEERVRGGRPKFSRWQPCRSLSPVERYTGGDRGPAWEAEIGGDRGDLSVVRSRKRKATQPDDRGQDMFWDSERQEGRVQGKDFARQHYWEDNRIARRQVRDFDNQTSSGRRVSVHGRRDVTGNRDAVRFDEEDRVADRAIGTYKRDSEVEGDWVSGGKATFYIANIPDNMPLFRLRQYFEVCGILSDVYVARHFNARGQVYGFVRFLNVKNRDKLGQALNSIWI